MADMRKLNLLFKYVKEKHLIKNFNYQIIKIKKSTNAFGENIICILKDTDRFYLPAIMVEELTENDGE